MSNFTKKENLYAVFDKISGVLYEFTVQPNDTLAVRSVLLTLRVPLKDSKLICLGAVKSNFDTNDEELDLSQLDFDWNERPRVVSWNCYKFPENVSDALAPLGLSPDEVRNLANKKIRDIGDDSQREETQEIVDKMMYGDK